MLYVRWLRLPRLTGWVFVEPPSSSGNVNCQMVLCQESFQFARCMAGNENCLMICRVRSGVLARRSLECKLSAGSVCLDSAAFVTPLSV